MNPYTLSIVHITYNINMCFYNDIYLFILKLLCFDNSLTDEGRLRVQVMCFYNYNDTMDALVYI